MHDLVTQLSATSNFTVEFALTWTDHLIQNYLRGFIVTSNVQAFVSFWEHLRGCVLWFLITLVSKATSHAII